MAKREKRRLPQNQNLFFGFKFRGRLKEAASGTEAAKYEPRIYHLAECDHVKSDAWWWDEDDRRHDGH